MKKRPLVIIIIGYVLALTCGVFLSKFYEIFKFSLIDKSSAIQCSLLATGFTNIEEFKSHATISGLLYLPQLIGFFGIILLKEWGRKCVIVLNVVMCGYLIYRMIFILQGVDTFSLINLFVHGGIVVFFSLPDIKEHFVGNGSFSQRKILIVDDDRGLLKMLNTALTKKGFSVVTAETGEEGLTLAHQTKPDLIILDVIMPRMKGREVCSRLKQDKGTMDIPVIFLTAKDSPDDRKAELDAGGLIHITKPLDISGFLSVVDKIFNDQEK